MRLPFLAVVLCAASLAVSATPASAFFGALFGGWVGRTVVSYPTGYRPGTIVIRTSERRLYLVLGNGQALRYGIGVGRVGFTWSGVTTISAKREWPDWTPPACWHGGPTCRATCAAVSTTRLARAPCIWARACTVSMARTNRIPSAPRRRQVVSG